MLPGFKVVTLPSAATGAVRDREKRTTPNATRYTRAERRRRRGRGPVAGTDWGPAVHAGPGDICFVVAPHHDSVG